MTGWAMLGLEAAGRNPLDLSSHGHTPVDYLRGHLDQLDRPGHFARTILALDGAGVDPRDFGGENLVSMLLSRRRDNGSYEGWPNSTAYAVIALRAAGASSGAVEASLSWLRQVQNDDGGWGDVPGDPSNADATGAVMQALSGESKAAHRGLSYLRQAQRPGGGFPIGGNGPVNTQSTAWAIEGILAAGGDPGSFRRGGASAPDYLANLQAGDGHYRYSKSSDQTPVWVTSEVLVAAAGDSLPIPPPPREPAAKTGGVSPSPSGPAPNPEPVPASPGGSASTGSGSESGSSSTPGQLAPGVPAGGAPGGSQGAGAGAGVPESLPPEASSESPTAEPADESSSGGSSSSPAGAVVLGLLAGALLFGAAFGARKLWMRRRYGL